MPEYRRPHPPLILLLALLVIAVGLWASPALAASPRLQVVTTSPDLADIARAVGGPRVTVTSIGRGDQNPHFIPPKPSFMLQLKDADLLVMIGMDLERAWLQPLVEGSRNRRIFVGGNGFVNASDGIKPLQVPIGQPDRLMGDVHAAGNPHYWLDPVNAKVIAFNILKGLERVDPEGKATYEAAYQAFLKELSTRLTGWMTQAKSLKGMKAISYHNTWPYFTHRFGLNIVGFVEPKPGIPPTPRHIQETIALVKQEKIPVIIVEPFFSRTVPDMIARETGARVVVLPPSVGGAPGADNYFSLFDVIFDRLLPAQEKPRP